ncbi:unnamed protein product [Moneuplotes crassus]|uniref:Uncharacterized protein n=1 Tax=Euplotes crassus TaxID=5936 RepID=A0AAD1XZ80_EUPCR|nr:unnamed protein product [Moneuplotes crassus]
MQRRLFQTFLTIVLLLTLTNCGILNSTDFERSVHKLKSSVAFLLEKSKDPTSGEVNGLGSLVELKSCPGLHEEVYDIDDEYSYTEPPEIKKNYNIDVHLWGVMDTDQHVDLLHVEVNWNGNLFHTEDHKKDDDVEEQEPYEVPFVWFIPGFAPGGHYDVDLYVKSAGSELGCERASFNL